MKSGSPGHCRRSIHARVPGGEGEREEGEKDIREREREGEKDK